MRINQIYDLTAVMFHQFHCEVEIFVRSPKCLSSFQINIALHVCIQVCRNLKLKIIYSCILIEMAEIRMNMNTKQSLILLYIVNGINQELYFLRYNAV
jgi:hypothetical protein